MIIGIAQSFKVGRSAIHVAQQHRDHFARGSGACL